MLQVIESKDIRPGEPRWFCPSLEDAQACMTNMEVGDLHTDDAVAVDCVGQEFAIVDRPSPSERDAILDDLLHHHEGQGGYRDQRDPARIDPILGRLRAAWVAHPDQRLGQLLVNSLTMPPGADPDRKWGRLYNAECAEFGAAGAPIEWPAPSTAQPPPVLDLDALAEAERAMTAGAWAANIFTTHVANSTQETQWHEAVVGSDVVCETECSAFEDETAIGAANIRGIVALRNAAPHLIAEARAAVALRAQICRLVSSQAIESDRLCQHHDADVVALAEVATLRERLAEAKRLGLEACTAWCRIVGSDGDDDGIAAVEKIAAELEAL